MTKFWDFKPSWQNSIDSSNAVSDTFIYSIVKVNDDIVGYGIIDKKTGAIPQIAVDKNIEVEVLERAYLKNYY